MAARWWSGVDNNDNVDCGYGSGNNNVNDKN